MTHPAARAAPLAAVLIALTLLATGLRAQPQPPPFAAGNPTAGKALADSDCVGCHAQRFAGKADQMYLRADHKVRTPAQLLSQVRTCNVQLGKNYFPEEEEHIAAYLNLQYYKFKP